ncbi:hypothetical protein ACNRWW_05455 [Metabacillus sp. HB246100]
MKKNKQLHPIINELFAGDFKEVNTSNITKIYKVNCSKMKTIDDFSFDSVWEFFSESFFAADGGIFIQPNSWTLINEIAETVTLRYFASKTKNTYLITDDITKEIKAIFVRP